MGILRRLTACLLLFCANPRSFLREIGEPDSHLRRLLSRTSSAQPEKFSRKSAHGRS